MNINITWAKKLTIIIVYSNCYYHGLNYFYAGDCIEGSFPIINRKDKANGTLNIRAQYIPVMFQQPSYKITGSYFTVSKGNRVRLYQDAHCSPPQNVPHFSQMQLPPGYTSFSSDPQFGPFYHPASCWRDLYDAIQVYLT